MQENAMSELFFEDNCNNLVLKFVSSLSKNVLTRSELFQFFFEVRGGKLEINYINNGSSYHTQRCRSLHIEVNKDSNDYIDSKTEA